MRARQPQQDHNPELKTIEAQMAAQRSRERDDDLHPVPGAR